MGFRKYTFLVIAPAFWRAIPSPPSCLHPGYVQKSIENLVLFPGIGLKWVANLYCNVCFNGGSGEMDLFILIVLLLLYATQSHFTIG